METGAGGVLAGGIGTGAGWATGGLERSGTGESVTSGGADGASRGGVKTGGSTAEGGAGVDVGGVGRVGGWAGGWAGSGAGGGTIAAKLDAAGRLGVLVLGGSED